MKRIALAVATALLMATTAGTAGAAPPFTPEGVNHPAFPQQCNGGPLGDNFFGWAVIANGGGVAHGVLPTGFIYEGGTATAPPDFSAGDPILGVSMYRTVLQLDESGNEVGTVGQGRSNGNANKAPDVGPAIADGIERVTTKWDVAVCRVTIPGFLLAQLYPDAEPPYVPEHWYEITNYLK